MTSSTLGRFQPSVIPIPGNPTPFSGLCKYCMDVVYMQEENSLIHVTIKFGGGSLVYLCMFYTQRLEALTDERLSLVCLHVTSTY